MQLIFLAGEKYTGKTEISGHINFRQCALQFRFNVFQQRIFLEGMNERDNFRRQNIRCPVQYFL